MPPAERARRKQQARQRLEQLESYLRQDPDNLRLLADAFQTALRCGEWTHAEAHLRHAQARELGDPTWALREADWLLAQERDAEARTVLERLALLAEPGTPLASVLAQNLAFIEFRRGDYPACIARLEPWVTDAPVPGDQTVSNAQQLWLRALHRAGETARACEWAVQAEQAGQLRPAAAGVAALAAIDSENFAAAQRWLRAAVAEAPTLESLVAQATLDLAAADARSAVQRADEALRMNPGEGRAWSIRAFAELLAGDLPTAQRDFDRAVIHMPAHIGTWIGRGWAQLLQHDVAAAQVSFEQALALDRNFAESHGSLAVALALGQQADAARHEIELAQRLDRNEMASRYAQAVLEGKAQDPEAVQQLARRLLAGRKAPLGGAMSDWLPGKSST